MTRESLRIPDAGLRVCDAGLSAGPGCPGAPVASEAAVSVSGRENAATPELLTGAPRVPAGTGAAESTAPVRSSTAIPGRQVTADRVWVRDSRVSAIARLTVAPDRPLLPLHTRHSSVTHGIR